MHDHGPVLQATAVLNPSESRRLLAKAVVCLPEVPDAYKNGNLPVATCSRAFVLEELTGEKHSGVEPGQGVDHSKTGSPFACRYPFAAMVSTGRRRDQERPAPCRLQDRRP
jgi:hypothetical protein